MKKKYAYSLMELMVVIFLIGLIAAAVGYNIKGSFGKGKEFKTVESARQIRDILLLEVASGTDIDLVVNNYQEFIAKSGIAKDPKKLVLDGWGEPFLVKKHKDDIEVISRTLKSINDKRNKELEEMTKRSNEEN